MKFSDFLTLYKESKKYWYILPRASYFNEKNLKELHEVLMLFEKEQYIKVKDVPAYQTEIFDNLGPEEDVLQIWNRDIQQEIQKKMIEKGIIKPTAQKRQSIADQLANIRNYINLFKKLGLAFFNKQNHLFISKAGNQFLSAEEKDWKVVLEEQIIKLQFWNFSLKPKELTKYEEFRIFPYLFTLKLILSLKQKYINAHEFALFVMPIKKDEEINISISLIENFRKLTEKQQRKVIKEANITMPHITNASVTLGFFGCTSTMKFNQGKLTITDTKRANLFINKIYPKMKFVDYVRFEDWFTYIGDTKFEMSNEKIIEYYIDMGKNKEAEKIIEFTDDIEEKETLKEALDKLLKEKLLEDALEKRPALLEEGLKLVKNGRQYKTDVSNIDLLTEKDSQYVVVELKKAKTEDDVVGQVLRYMGWVRQNLSKTKLVRGIIVVMKGEMTLKLEMAIKGLQTSKDLIKLVIIPITVDNAQEVKI